MERKEKSLTIGIALGVVKEFIKKQIERDLRRGNSPTIVLDAYNRMQTDECSGANYIFNINNQKDLKYLVDNSLADAQLIGWIVSHPDEVPMGVFHWCGEEQKGVKPINNLVEFLINSLDELIPFVLLYVDRVEEYQDLYTKYFTDMLYETEFFQVF